MPPKGTKKPRSLTSRSLYDVGRCRLASSLEQSRAASGFRTERLAWRTRETPARSIGTLFDAFGFLRMPENGEHLITITIIVPRGAGTEKKTWLSCRLCDTATERKLN